MANQTLPDLCDAYKWTPEGRRDSLDHTVEFSELLRLHWGQVFRTCLCIVRDHHDAEDAAQDCFLRAFAHLHQFKGEAQISTWLNSIARNCSLMLLRKKRNRREVMIENSLGSDGNSALLDPPDSRPDQLKNVLCAENFRLLVKSVAALPNTLRTTADLILLNERTLQEVGQILEVSNAAVKSRLFRARRRLMPISKTRRATKVELR